MAYLIGQLILPLLLATLGGGLAGWSWHCIRMRDAWAGRDAMRDRLRNELLTYVGVAPPEQGIHMGAGELEALQVRLGTTTEQLLSMQRDLTQRDEEIGGHRSRIAELEMALASAQAELRDHAGPEDAQRLAALEDALHGAEAKASELSRRADDLQAALDSASAVAAPQVDVAAMRWRIRELESQLSQREAEASVARIVAPPAAPVERPDLEDALLREHWRGRYLQARVTYLEGAAAPAPAPAAAPAPVAAPVDEEADNRRRWRQRYLEARVAWLEGRARDHADARTQLEGAVAARDGHIAALQAAPPQVVDDGRIAALTQRVAELEGALAASRAETVHSGRRLADLEATLVTREARIAELEAAPPPPAPDDMEAGRLRWRSRYLDSRVRHLEQTLAVAAQTPPPAPPAPRDDAFRPIAPQGPEVRPQGLPAPRGGAPDDLRLIDGVGPRVESTLNSLGVYHFDQIAAWTPANIEWIERYLAFKGRIGRETWVEQAAALARGEMSRRRLEDERV